MITRRWEKESGLEYIRQVLKDVDTSNLSAFKILTLPFDNRVEDESALSFQSR